MIAATWLGSIAEEKAFVNDTTMFGLYLLAWFLFTLFVGWVAGRRREAKRKKIERQSLKIAAHEQAEKDEYIDGIR